MAVAIDIADAKQQLGAFNAQLTGDTKAAPAAGSAGAAMAAAAATGNGSGKGDVKDAKDAGGREDKAKDAKGVEVQLSETPLADYSAGKVRAIRCEIRQRRILKGHFGRVYALQWASDSRHLLSASQDGKLLLWNAFTTNKVHAVPLRSSWVMSCSIAPGCDNRLIAAGGLDNTCTVYRLPDWAHSGSSASAAAKADAYNNKLLYGEMSAHEAYVSCIRFIGDDELLTASGDSTAILWDVDTRTPKRTFTGHSGDVLSCAPFVGTGTGGSGTGGGGASAGSGASGSAGGGPAVFVTSSCDSTCALWDARAGGDSKSGRVHVFVGHETDVNCTAWFPDGNGFASGSDDASMRLWDVRAAAQLNRFAANRLLCGVTSCAFSLTGRVLFGGYDDYNVYAWDSQLATEAGQLQAHENRVSCVGVSRDGKALATGSWDTLIRIWA